MTTVMSKTAYERVKTARASTRPTGEDYIINVFSGFIEMHGDKGFADDPAVVAGIAMLGGAAFTVIATEKGHDTKSRLRRNFGTPNPEGYRKALRLMKQAEKFNRPVVCFVDTSGAFCGIGAEERGQGQAIAACITGMLSLKVPVLSVLVGEGGSGGALALACADEVWMLENAIYSVISPEGCANILWREPDRAAEAAEALKLTASDVMALGVVERIIPEVSRDPDRLYNILGTEISKWYSSSKLLRPEDLVQRRYERFRKMGAL